MLKYLEELCNLPGVSGWEDSVREYISEKAAPYAQQMYTDAMGNLFVLKKGKQPRDKKLMVCAHMDEVGIIVTDIDDKGYLKFAFVGGVDRRVAIGKRVRVGTEGVVGVIGVKAVHLTTKEERKKVPKTDDMFIDIGAQDKEQAQKLVSLGDRGVFEGESLIQGDWITAKAIDDRVGCAAMIKLIESELEYDTWFVFTVQEEVGLRGATAAAHSLAPDYALVLEGTTAADLPDAEGTQRVCTLSGGAVIGMVDKSTVYDRKMSNKLHELADNNNIPSQVKTVIAGGTDAGAIHKSRGGVPTANIAVPVRYIHSPSCVTSLSAIKAMYSLAELFVNLPCKYDK